MHSVLIVCGAGASSTFLASRLRAFATAAGLELVIRATSDAELRSRLPTTTVLLVGPHLESSFEALRAEAAEFGVTAALLPQNAFAPGGAEAALDIITGLMNAGPTPISATESN